MEQSFFAGPFIGKKTSTLILSKDELVIREHSTKESWKYGFSQQLGFPNQPFSEILNKEIDQNSVHEILNSSTFVKHPLSEIEKIELIHSAMRNKIFIKFKNGSESKFSIYNRGKTDFYFELFLTNYPELTVEINKPETLIQKALNY